MIQTLIGARTRTLVEIFKDPDIDAVKDAYNAFEAVQTALTDKTWIVQPIAFFYDGTNYIIVAGCSYVERSDIAGGTVPEGV